MASDPEKPGSRTEEDKAASDKSPRRDSPRTTSSKRQRPPSDDEIVISVGELGEDDEVAEHEVELPVQDPYDTLDDMVPFGLDVDEISNTVEPMDGTEPEAGLSPPEASTDTDTGDEEGEMPQPDDQEDDSSDQFPTAGRTPEEMARSEDPRELRFQLRRARRKLKEMDKQSDKLRKMAAQEAIERTRLTLAVKQATERADKLDRELQELKRDHREARGDIERWRDATDQARKELESMQDRRRKEREEVKQYGHGAVITELLPVFDHMELAVTHAEANPERIVEGVQMVMDQLDQAFTRLGVERVDCGRGKAFQPELHEAMLHVDDSDLPTGTIVGELRPGYILNGRLLRAARVSVSAAPDGEPIDGAVPPGEGSEAASERQEEGEPTLASATEE